MLATIGWWPPLAHAYVRVVDWLLPRWRRVAMRNLRLALPELTEAEHRQIVDGSFRSQARMLGTLARFPGRNSQNISEWIRYDGFEHFEQAKARGKGVLFATAHLGNWELSAFAHAWMGEPMHIVVRPLDNPLVDAYLSRLRTMSGNRIIGKKDYARVMLRALGRNEAVGILIDQNVSHDEGVFVPFFGVQACVSPGLARMAAHTGATVIPGFALWSDVEQKYVLRFYPPLEMSGDALEDTRRIHAQLEGVIREYPDQWLWMHRRWKTRPAGEPGVY